MNGFYEEVKYILAGAFPGKSQEEYNYIAMKINSLREKYEKESEEQIMDGMKEVYFDQYCPTWVSRELKEDEEACYDCLAEPVNQQSQKPVNYEECTRGKKQPENEPEEEVQ